MRQLPFASQGLSPARTNTPPGKVRRRGFTLLEILMAVSIGGSLLIAAVSFALSMGELWGNGTETRLFDQHVRGVSRFFENVLRQAQPAPEPATTGDAGASQTTARQGQAGSQAQAQVQESATSPVSWQAPRGNSFGDDELLTFELAESPGVLAWPEQPLPYVVCALRVDRRQGLSLLWKSRLEVDFEDESPREMLVSPFVTGISYLYFDNTETNPKWEETDRPKTGTSRELLVPQRVRLVFEYEGERRTVDLVIPGAAASVPLY